MSKLIFVNNLQLLMLTMNLRFCLAISLSNIAHFFYKNKIYKNDEAESPKQWEMKEAGKFTNKTL